MGPPDETTAAKVRAGFTNQEMMRSFGPALITLNRGGSARPKGG